MCRPSNKNPNWKGGITINRQIKACIYCGIEFKSQPYTISVFCSNECHNFNQWAISLINKRRLYIAKRFVAVLFAPIKFKRTCGLKKHYCSICFKNQVSRAETKYCDECRPKKFELQVTCKYCGKISIKYKGQGTQYCNMDCRTKDISGDKNPNYIDGRKPINKKIRDSEEYKQWRISVFERDKYTCVWCGRVGGELNADHIKPFALYAELRLDINNGRTLCKPCHKKTDSYLKRKSNAVT